MVTLRVPKLFDLKADPFERSDKEGVGYARWRIDRIFLLVPAQAFVGRYIESLVAFPPRQKPGSFNLQGILDKLTAPPQGAN
jgi:arylsulfatase